MLFVLCALQCFRLIFSVKELTPSLYRDDEVNTDVHGFDLDLPIKIQICSGQRHEHKMSKWRFERLKWCGPTARSVLKQI